MKKLKAVVVILAFLLNALSVGAVAQERHPSAKDIYLTHVRNPKRGRPGIKIAIELKRDGATRMVPVTYSFRDGDQVRFHFETNFKAYLKIVHVGSTGTAHLLYPDQGVTEAVSKTRDYAIPQDGRWFVFDQNRGLEQLTFIFSSRPLLVETPAIIGASIESGADTDQQQALVNLNLRSLENGKDITLARDKPERESFSYGVVAARIVRQPIGIRVSLRHE